jgi:hypothetical protein
LKKDAQEKKHLYGKMRSDVAITVLQNYLPVIDRLRLREICQLGKMEFKYSDLCKKENYENVSTCFKYWKKFLDERRLKRIKITINSWHRTLHRSEEPILIF